MDSLPRIFTACITALLASSIVWTSAVSADSSGPRVGYEYWIPCSETDSAGQHGIHFKEFVNGSAYRPRFPFSFQRWDDPQLEALKRRLGIDELIAGASSEFEQVTRITSRVCNLWAHSGPVEYPIWSALQLLDNFDQGENYWCTYKQLVLMQCLAAIGIQSRIVPCHWHHSHEFWSNEYAKWVVMDAWTNNYYHKDGVPIGALELHRLSRATGSVKGTGVWEMNINPNRWMPERTTDSIPADTPCYQHIRYIPRNDFLSAPLAPKPAGAPGAYLNANSQINDPLQTALLHVAWWQPGDPPTIACPTIQYEQDFNFPLNEVEMTLHRPVFEEGVLEVTLDTHTPEFDTYFRKTGSGDWESCGGRFLWKLEPGVNRLELKTRNKWGRFGPVSRAVLEYRPDELKAPVVDRLAIPNPGFEQTTGNVGVWKGSPAEGWKMVFTDPAQKPAFFGAVENRPHSGKKCFKITLNDQHVWARLISGKFRVNQASDVTVRVWLRADRDERQATLYVKDATPNGPGAQNVAYERVRLTRNWRQYELKARLSARTTDLMVGAQVLEGTLWIDDFSITEDARAELPW